MNSLIDSALGRSRTIIATLLLVLVSGTVAYIEIPKESDPDISIPIIYVRLNFDGISPEDSERLLIRPMEEELRVIEGVKEMRSSGYEGGGSVVLEFEAGFDADAAMDDVREKVDFVKPDLPDGADEPTVHEVNISLFPVLVVILSGEVPERTLLRLARELRDAVEGISSVLAAEIAGDREDLVEVIVDPIRIESYGLAANEAIAAVRNSNLVVAAGTQDTGRGRFSIKVPGLFEAVEDILDMPLVVRGDAVVTVRDIAEVRSAFKDAQGFARAEGRPAVALEVSKRAGENIIETIERVRAVVEAERAAWPEPLRQTVAVTFSQDKSDDVRIVLGDLKNNVISAVLLVMIVVVAALGWRTGGLVGVAIPGSFLTGILVLAVLGLTINIVVLFSLILAVGMLVDGAIVVTEYADRKMCEGEPRGTAYALAAKRMAWPITASTATTLAAFMPLLFWPGVVGEFMVFLPITLLATLSASLLMALIFIPTLGAQIGRPGTTDPEAMRALAAAESGALGDLGGATGAYVRGLGFLLRHPAKVVTLALALLVGVQWFYAAQGNGIEFFPDVEPDFAKVQVRARGNLSVLEKDGIMREVERRVLEVSGFDSVYARTGTPENSQEAADIIGSISLELADWRSRRPAREIMAEIKDRTADLAGIYVDVRKQEQGPPVGKPIQLELSSRYPDLLPAAVETILAGLMGIDALINVEDSRPLPGIDWEMRVDRAQAAKFGADVAGIGHAVRLVTTGIKLGEYRPESSDDEVEIRVRYPSAYRNIEQLDHIRLKTNEGLVPIANFVSRTPRPRVGTIRRVDGKRVMTVKADVAEGVLADDKVREIQAWLPSANLDSRIDVTFKGEDEEQKKAEAFLLKAFAVALSIMAIILVTQFNSFYSAFLILSAVVMSTIGVMIGLLVIGQPFGIVMSGIGVIALAGIVVNNNIVLIDTFDRLMEKTGNVREAILRTGAQRMRPVLLTTVTTILGLMPMVLGVNINFVTREVLVGAPSSQWWHQLSAAIVFGLGFATLLTLVVTPSALMLRGNLGAWRRRRNQARSPLRVDAHAGD
ncbi:MAG: efflux RND transporter permease subunit [Rhodospirillales bacterium]|nr:efflux RND transporter permease subunit [Rhodospirillales bacterium]